MPSTKPIPTVSDFLRAAANAIRGRRDKRADTREGSVYEMILGPAAMLFARQVQRDRDMFRSVYNDAATGAQLSALILEKYGVERVEATSGTGTATLERASAAAGAGTIWAGTRVFLASSTTEVREFSVTADTTVSATAIAVEVPIRAAKPGRTAAISVTSGLVVADPLWDATWTVTGLTCGEGTDFEDARALVARVRNSRLRARRGHEQAIVDACVAAGAVNVVAFASSFANTSPDPGFNAVYVGDGGYSASTSLVRACQVACEAARPIGADTYFGAMTPSSLSMELTVTLWDQPATFDQVALTQMIRDVIVHYFAVARNAYAYRRDAIAGAILRASSAVQAVTFTTPASDAAITLGDWPATLTRYRVTASDITVTLAGPA